MDTPLDPAQTKGRRMSPTRAPSSDPGGASSANTYSQDTCGNDRFSLENGWVSFKIRSFPREN